MLVEGVRNGRGFSRKPPRGFDTEGGRGGGLRRLPVRKKEKKGIKLAAEDNEGKGRNTLSSWEKEIRSALQGKEKKGFTEKAQGIELPSGKETKSMNYFESEIPIFPPCGRDRKSDLPPKVHTRGGSGGRDHLMDNDQKKAARAD